MFESSQLSQLPGYEIYREGIEAIRKGDFNSAPALLLGMASIRLREAGLPVLPAESAPALSAHLQFYQLLAKQYSDAHNRYNASLQRLDKFCRAVEMLGNAHIKHP